MEEWDNMFFKKKKVKFGNIYACETGKHAGKMLIYIDSNESQYGFLTIPVMENLWVPKDEFDIALKNDILKFVENAPRPVKITSKAQFDSNEEVVRSTD